MLHFSDTDFTTNKRNLKKSAVPKKFEIEDTLKVLIPTKTYIPRHFPKSPKPIFSKSKWLNINSPEFTPKQIEKRNPKTSDILYLSTPTKAKNNQSSQSDLSLISTPKSSPRTKTIINSTIHFPSPPTTTSKILLSHKNCPNTKKINIKVQKLKQLLKDQGKLLKNKRSSISKLRNNLSILRSNVKNNDIFNKLQFPSKDSKTLVKMQILRTKISRKPWSFDEQQFALSLFYKSPSAYKFLKNSKQIILPGLSTIRRWIGNSKFKTGFNNGILKQLKIKTGTMTEQERFCTLIFDEMKIKNFLEYSKFLDLVEGFEDLGSIGRSKKLAGQAMVFMIRGVYSSWKLPFAYFLPSTSVNHGALSELLIEAITKLFDCGFIVLTMVCDQGTNNVSALIKDLNMTKDKPFIEINGRKVFSIFDVPHLYKNLRNNFIKNNFIYKGNETSFQDLKDTYELDKNSNTSRSLLKITNNHINPGPFQLMSCKLAMQLFSNSMAASMQSCILTKQLQSKTAPHTVEMIKDFNNLLDILNSNSLFDSNPYKCAISKERPQQLDYLLKAQHWIETLKKKKIKERQDIRPPCFDGLIWTINSIKMIYTQQCGLGYNYLLTSRFNSDAIENAFSVFRQRGGYNR
jgi:DNA transposase THAP9